MKFEDWKNVKVHQLLILANEEVGAVKCEVIEIDVKIVETLPTYHYEFPYGKTVLQGIVKIRYSKNGVIQEEVANLADLVAYLPATLKELSDAYSEWQKYDVLANTYKEEFNTLIQNHKVE